MTKSPFPGIDPYLEAKWPEVHASLIVYSRNHLNARLPNDLQTNIEENLAVRFDDETSRTIRPDIHIEHQADHSGGVSTMVAEEIATATEPIIVKRAAQPERYLSITTTEGRVVTVIEFLSPWNKIGSRARDKYSQKQTELINAGVNLVEIDLVRQGEYVLAAIESNIPQSYRKPYMTCVYRDIRADQFEIYSAHGWEPLPTISIPLRPTDRDVLLPLQPIIDTCYRDGRYDRIDYQQDPTPPLDRAETAKIDEHLRLLGLRK